MQLRGLYAITDTKLTHESGLLRCVMAALAGGAVMVQYRDKSNCSDRRRREARDLLAACRQFQVPLIINDDIDLAREIGAAGVHVGRGDAAVAIARAALGPSAIIGASCYHELDRASSAQDEGADYVAFGRVYASSTKPGAALATLDLLREAHSRLSIPVVAIGGIRTDNAATLIEAGVDMVAVINDLWTAPDCEARARAFTACFRG
jgi:thiamine-phosphate pyrophosphorylase